MFKVDPQNPCKKTLRKVAELILKGKVVAYPTETVYGLGVNALDEGCVRRLFEIKGRPKKPISVVVSDLNMAKRIAEINETALKLMKRFLPGPLTIVVKKKDVIPSILTAGTEKVGLRMPDHKVPLKIVEYSGVPITSTSANPSGKKSPTRAEEVIRYFGDRVDVVVDGGETKLKVESTVIDTTTYPPKILRLGAITVEEIEEVVEVSHA